MSAGANSKRVCGFLTDVEGNYEYFQRYVEISKVLSWSGPGKERLELRDGAEVRFFFSPVAIFCLTTKRSMTVCISLGRERHIFASFSTRVDIVQRQLTHVLLSSNEGGSFAAIPKQKKNRCTVLVENSWTAV